MLGEVHVIQIIMLAGIAASLLLHWRQCVERRSAMRKFRDLCARLESGPRGRSATEVEARVQQDLDWIYNIGIAVGLEKAKQR